jgi:hypothetical protein
VALLALVLPAPAQYHGTDTPYCPSPHPLPALPPAPKAPPPAEKAKAPAEKGKAPAEEARPEEQPQAPEQPATEDRGDVPGGPEEAVAAPNFLGDLLFASRSINFRYSRSTGLTNVANNGATSVINSTISDNNSPLPRDRVGFRYNHFDNSQSVTGFGNAIPGPGGVSTAFAQTRNFDLDRFTFNFEKTFLDRLVSVELRVPFSTTLSPDLNLSAGDITGPVLDASGRPVNTPNGPAFGVNPTPQNTLGDYGTRLENLSVIFKGLLYRSQPLALSAGVGVGVPSGSDTRVRVTDYAGSTTSGLLAIQRVRYFQIDNETWSLSPFLAALATPTDRFFAQGFVQFDFPLNSSTIGYTETFARGTAPLFALPGLGVALAPPFSVGSGITEQPLMHLDFGTGYWLVRDPSRRWLTGLAPTVELHYTTTLKNASVVTLPQDGFTQVDPQTQNSVAEAAPRVGNLRNRMDILDMTVGTTFEVANRAFLATGVAFPLRGNNDRTFDWEFHLQLNYYFGGLGRRAAPNF